MQICCVGCGVFVVDELKNDFDEIVLYFYNPNIWPSTEYDRRLEEAKKIAEKFHYEIIIAENNHSEWLGMVKGLEGEPEKGKRCLVCYHDRLEATAQKAKELGFDYFGTTLTTSPHKDAVIISEMGLALENKYNIKYLDRDFKKGDGFKKSCQITKELNLYRQTYCGCEFSIRK